MSPLPVIETPLVFENQYLCLITVGRIFTLDTVQRRRLLLSNNAHKALDKASYIQDGRL